MLLLWGKSHKELSHSFYNIFPGTLSKINKIIYCIDLVFNHGKPVFTKVTVF